jgi:hypothetical protein
MLHAKQDRCIPLVSVRQPTLHGKEHARLCDSPLQTQAKHSEHDSSAPLQASGGPQERRACSKGGVGGPKLPASSPP